VTLRILAIGPQNVCPPTDGGKEGIHGALAALAELADVSYAYPCSKCDRSSVDAYRVMNVRPLPIARMPVESTRAILSSTLHGEPYKFAKYASAEATNELANTIGNLDFDLILCFHAHSFGLSERLQRMKGWRLPVIVREHNIEYELVSSFRAALDPLRRLLAWPFEFLTRRAELRIWARADATAFLTDRDLAVARAAGTGRRLVLAPEGIPIGPPRVAQPPAADLQLLLLLNPRATQSAGNARRFLREYWRAVHNTPRLQSISLAITGVDLHQLAELSDLREQSLMDMRVRALGFLPSLDDVFSTSLALVSPTFVGGGIRKKVLEAMANQLPVIASRVDIESCGYFDPPRNILQFDTPDEFVLAVEHLLIDPQVWTSLSNAARRTVEAHAGWKGFADVIVPLANELIAARQSASPSR
jgi:glycosyltransferase involved in cell wall biosynthesis